MSSASSLSSSSSSDSVNRSRSLSPKKAYSVEEFASRLDSELKEEIENFRFSNNDGDDNDSSTASQGLEFPSQMPENYLDLLRKRYNILDNIVLRLPKEGERACDLPEGCVTLYLNMFEYGFRLLVHPLAQEFLARTGLALAQVAPMGGVSCHLRVGGVILVKVS